MLAILWKQEILEIVNSLFFETYKVELPPFHGGNTGSNPVRVVEGATPRKPASAKVLQLITVDPSSNDGVSNIGCIVQFFEVVMADLTDPAATCDTCSNGLGQIERFRWSWKRPS
jgi:hypothetical protein